MLFSEAMGRKVVSTTTAETVGKIDGFVVDPKTHKIVALQLKKTDEGQFLGWPDIKGFGDDAVTVEDAALIIEPSDQISALAGKDHGMLGKRVLSDRGDELGDVKDVEFDAATGEVTAIQHVGGSVAGSSLTGIGSYAIVVGAAGIQPAS